MSIESDALSKRTIQSVFPSVVCISEPNDQVNGTSSCPVGRLVRFFICVFLKGVSYGV